jgi:hypothetical protein
MGLSISFKFSLKNATADQAREKVIALHNLALQLPFESVHELVEIEGDARYFDEYDLDDPHSFIKIRGLNPIESAVNDFSWENSRYIISFHSLPGKGCEPAIFGLATHDKIKDTNDWSWTSFCKTQYASNPDYGGMENFLKCHLTLIEMIDKACELGIDCDVNDEGEYWENRDIDELKSMIRQYNIFMAAFTGRMKDDLAKKDISSESTISEYPNFEYLEAEGHDQLPNFE